MIQSYAYFAQPENLLLSIIDDNMATERKLRYNGYHYRRILKATEISQDKIIKSFVLLKSNFSAEELHQIID